VCRFIRYGREFTHPEGPSADKAALGSDSQRTATPTANTPGLVRGKQSVWLAGTGSLSRILRAKPTPLSNFTEVTMRTKNRPVAFRATETQYKIIKTKANKAKMSLTDFLISTALQKEINVIEDLKPLLYELKSIGRNLNQLTTLANMGKLREVNLIETTDALEKNYDAIHELIRRSGGG